MKNYGLFAHKRQHVPKLVPPLLEDLPVEVLREILLFIPESELLNKIRKVNLLWHNIIFSTQFANAYIGYHGSPLKRFYSSSLEKLNGSARNYLDVLTGREIGDNTGILFKQSCQNFLDANENPVFDSTIAKMGYMTLHPLKDSNDGTTTSLNLTFPKAIRNTIPLLMQQIKTAKNYLTQLEQVNADASIPASIFETLPFNEIRSQLRILKIKIAAFDLICSVKNHKPDDKKAALICLKALDRILKYMPSADFENMNNRRLNELTDLFQLGSFQDGGYKNRLRNYNKRFGYRHEDKVACQFSTNLGLFLTPSILLVSLLFIGIQSDLLIKSDNDSNGGVLFLILSIVMCSMLSVGSSIAALIFYCRAFRYCLDGLKSRARFLDPDDSYPIELHDNSTTGKMRAAITELTKYLGILSDSVTNRERLNEEAVTETSSLLQYTR